MELGLIGVDCATADSDVGLALGRMTATGARIDSVLCGDARAPAAIVTDWLRQMRGPSLIAIDAPLGWPEPMGRHLARHRAGRPIDTEPNEFFRRATDRVVHRNLKKLPLDVGADRIARTAHAALRFLQELREALAAPIPLAWSPDGLDGPAAIEVYPAATLIAHSLPSKGYKKADQAEARRGIVTGLRRVIEIHASTDVCETSADALDAMVCVVAAADFANGVAMGPEDRRLAEREGWIWVASMSPAVDQPAPTVSPRCAPSGRSTRVRRSVTSPSRSRIRRSSSL